MKTNRNDPEYSFNHTKDRMWERHKLRLSRQDYEQLCFYYIQNKADNPRVPVQVIGVEDHQKIFMTEFKKKKLKFVWCDKRKTITTVF